MQKINGIKFKRLAKNRKFQVWYDGCRIGSFDDYQDALLELIATAENRWGNRASGLKYLRMRYTISDARGKIIPFKIK